MWSARGNGSAAPSPLVPAAASADRSEMPSRCSITRYSSPPVRASWLWGSAPVISTWTTLGWTSRLATLASRWKRVVSSGFPESSRWSTFTATSRSMPPWKARYTRPIDPMPIRLSSRICPGSSMPRYGSLSLGTPLTPLSSEVRELDSGVPSRGQNSTSVS